MKLSEFIQQQARAKEQGGSNAPAAAQKPPVKVLRTRPTPNPDALQFVLNTIVLDKGKKSYAAASECGGDRMAEALFAIPGVRGVFVMENFVTVNKDGAAEWTALRDPVWKTIDRLAAYYENHADAGAVNLAAADFTALVHADKLRAIESVLDRSIRANLARDGGGVELKGLEGNIVLIRYQGACGSCPSSSGGTLQYIERQVQQQLHKDLQVKSA